MEGVDEVVRQARQQVDDEPRLEVVETDDARVGDDLAGRADERRVEVDEYVDEKHDVDDRVDYEDRRRVERLAVERDVVRHHDGRVERQQQYQPVPLGLEHRVVQDDVLRRLGRLLSVVRQRLRGIETHQLYNVIRTPHARNDFYLPGKHRDFKHFLKILVTIFFVFRFSEPFMQSIKVSNCRLLQKLGHAKEDLTEVFKILKAYENISKDLFFDMPQSSLRGHSLKLNKKESHWMLLNSLSTTG